MKQIKIENGVIRYYGNRVGRVTEGCAVVDPMFQNEALESFLRKQRNIQKIQWQDGIYDGKGVKRCTHLATERRCGCAYEVPCTFPDGAAIWLPQAGFLYQSL